MEDIEKAWKNASEEMYKAQAEAGSTNQESSDSQPPPEAKGGDDVQDVDFEEVKE